MAQSKSNGDPRDAVRAVACRLAVETRWHSGNEERIVDIRRDLAEAKLAKYIKGVVSAAPALKPEAVERLTALLRPAE